MISYYTICTFLLCHWIFDFHLQTNEMAQKKSFDNFALLDHVNMYMFGLLVMMTLNVGYFKGPWWDGPAFVFINTMAHFFTDWMTSRASSPLYKDQRFHDFFTVIGGDQMIHYMTLFGTFVWLTQ